MLSTTQQKVVNGNSLARILRNAIDVANFALDSCEDSDCTNCDRARILLDDLSETLITAADVIWLNSRKL